MLSGDKTTITQKLANHLGIKEAFGDLLPAGKVAQLEQLKKEKIM
jgi:Cd2+/Zn2+-exporting ATPase